jgi:hypothetical protein
MLLRGQPRHEPGRAQRAQAVAGSVFVLAGLRGDRSIPEDPADHGGIAQ